MESVKNALALVIAPLTEEDFFNDYWEKDPLHIHRSDAAHFESLTSIDAIETLLSTQSLSYPSVQLTRSGHTIDVSDYTDDSNRIQAHRLIEEHRNGATIVISQAHQNIPSLAEFRRGMQRDCHLRCQTNLYLSPPSQQGFNAHYDSHDVFILQVHGDKTFNFYEGGVELPFQHDRFESTQQTAGALTKSITLTPGDTLYIPRGVMHDAVACKESSLHITLGVYAVTHRDLILEAIQLLTTDDPAFRKSIPRQWLANNKQTGTDDSNKPSLAAVPSTQLTDSNLLQALSNLLDNAAIDSQASCMGGLTLMDHQQASNQHSKAQKPKELSEQFDKFQINSKAILTVERTDDQLRVRTHGSVLEFRDPARALVERLLEAPLSNDRLPADFSNDDIQHVFACLRSANLLESADS